MKGLALRRRNRGGCLVKLLVLATFFAAAFALAWMLFLPVVLTQQLRSRTGFDAEVTNFAVNPITGHVVLRGLVLSNPAAFGMKDGSTLVWDDQFGEKPEAEGRSFLGSVSSLPGMSKALAVRN